MSGPTSTNLQPFPMQDGPPIPWFLAEIIYEHLYRFRSQTLAELAGRGGFGWDEVSTLWCDKSASWGTTPGHREAARTEVNYVLTELNARRLPAGADAPALFTTSERGFKHYEPIASTYGDQVRVYESSAADSPHLWVALDSSRSQLANADAAPAAHLDVEAVEALIATLQVGLANHYQRDGAT